MTKRAGWKQTCAASLRLLADFAFVAQAKPPFAKTTSVLDMVAGRDDLKNPGIGKYAREQLERLLLDDEVLYCELSSDLLATMLPSYVHTSARGTVAYFGQAAKAAATRQKADKTKIAEISQQISNCGGFFDLPTALVPVAAKEGWGPSRTRLAIQIFSELTADSKRYRRDALDRGEGTMSKRRLYQRSSGNFYGAQGSKATGYTVKEWLFKAKYGSREKPQPAILRRFLEDLRGLQRSFGLDLEIKGVTNCMDDSLLLLRRLAGQPRRWKDLLLKFFVPVGAVADLDERWHLLVGAGTGLPGQKGFWNGYRLTIARKKAGLSL